MIQSDVNNSSQARERRLNRNHTVHCCTVCLVDHWCSKPVQQYAAWTLVFSLKHCVSLYIESVIITVWERKRHSNVSWAWALANLFRTTRKMRKEFSDSVFRNLFEWHKHDAAIVHFIKQFNVTTYRESTYATTRLLYLLNLNSCFWAKRNTNKFYIISNTIF